MKLKTGTYDMTTGQSSLDRMTRSEAMTKLREEVKKSRYTYGDIAQSAGVSANWVGVVLRGGYPCTNGNMLPKNIRQALETYKFQIEKNLITHF